MQLAARLVAHFAVRLDAHFTARLKMLALTASDPNFVQIENSAKRYFFVSVGNADKVPSLRLQTKTLKRRFFVSRYALLRPPSTWMIIIDAHLAARLDADFATRLDAHLAARLYALDSILIST